MCDSCDGISRREWLKVSAVGLGLAGLAGCQTERAVEAELPSPVYEDEIVAATPGPAVRIDPRTIRVPKMVAAEASEYGEILPRGSWTHVPLRLAHGVPMGGVERITMHHSGDGKRFLDTSLAGVARHLQIVQRAHLQRGMIDIAYHFAVDPAGRVWQLRWLGYEGQHVRMGKNGMRWNAHNVGIVALGDFNLQRPTVKLVNRLFKLVGLVKGKYGVRESNVRMHGELVQTDCPGRWLRAEVLVGRREGRV